jgi:methylglutaconyl-CoA hydratase
VFCAGADLNWMHEMAGYTEEQNNADALALADMLNAIDSCPVPVVGRVHRAAFGGAIGLLACCDSVICTSDTRFAFSEVRLGISPATISPFVISKIGAAGARDLFLSGEQFDAERAMRAGLVSQVVETDDLDSAVERKIAELLKAGPQAAIETKALVKSMTKIANEELRIKTASLIARLRVSSEGQEGLGAFLQKRSPSWIKSE